eukprot:3491280-Rhodomonas_salina.2
MCWRMALSGDARCPVLNSGNVRVQATTLEGMTELNVSKVLPICLRACYAMSGTDIAHAATRIASP